MHRRSYLAFGGPGQVDGPNPVGTHGPCHLRFGFAFEAGGSGRPAALYFQGPLAFEAFPLPVYSGGNGGRCNPHSKVLLIFPAGGPGFTRGHLSEAVPLNGNRTLGLANGLVNESAQPDIHYQAYRQKYKQCG